MGDGIEQFIFKQELTRLYGDYERCSDINLKKEISEDIQILQEAIELLSV